MIGHFTYDLYSNVLILNLILSNFMVFMLSVQYAFNLFSHNAPILDNGYNEEEMKLVKETRKIWVSGLHFTKLKIYFVFVSLCSSVQNVECV